MYNTLEQYQNLYGSITENEYSRLVWEADRILDKHTTGIDNVHKLREAFPTDEYDAEAVRRCESALVNLLHSIEQVEKSAMGMEGVTAGKAVASVSSGSESITYATDAASSVIYDAAGNMSAREAIIAKTVRNYLSGVADAHGVNLLYMGVYPHVC